MSERTHNIIGALSLAIADEILRTAQSKVASSAPAAGITLLAHAPGMSIDQLRHVMGLSHPGAVRLVDRLVRDGLVMRSRSKTDGRAVSLKLTSQGEILSNSILSSRQGALKAAIDRLDPNDREIFGRIAETVLRGMVRDADHGLGVCRLCDPQSCTDCPVDTEMLERQTLA
ncbi:MAG: MarR family transcriptional regulator [Beijerinckiaceae bacterium]|nr:MarR family transcriptional regulator [Beijerinckiaceae bacterium]